MASLLAGCGQTGTPAQGGVQDYMPDNAVIAHRGTIYWAPSLPSGLPLGTQHGCRLPGARCTQVKGQCAHNNA
jgi:hypothetical protein